MAVKIKTVKASCPGCKRELELSYTASPGGMQAFAPTRFVDKPGAWSVEQTCPDCGETAGVPIDPV